VDVMLTFRGQLPTCSRTDSRAKEKADLRNYFSTQLERHWRQNRELNEKLEQHALRPAQVEKSRFLKFTHTPPVDNYFRPYAEFRSRSFIPLVISLQRQMCDLEIRWLRNEAPGSIYTGGDIDGRLKTLFDALRIPHNDAEAMLSMQDKLHCFCLLEDDSLIRNLIIETGRLLEPMEKPSDIHLQLRATIVSEDE
jgi:hypothetical protein